MGAYASGLDRHSYKVKVGGSNPPVPTNCSKKIGRLKLRLQVKVILPMVVYNYMIVLDSRYVSLKVKQYDRNVPIIREVRQ